MKIANVTFALGLCLALSQAGVAQDGCDRIPELCKLDSAIGDLKGAVLTGDPGVSVSVDEKGAKGSVQWAHYNLGHSYSATLTSPVDKESGVAETLGIRGLEDTTSLKLEYNYTNWPNYDLYNLFENSPEWAYDGGKEIEREQFRRVTQCLYYADLIKKNRDALLLEDEWSDELERLHTEFGKAKLPTKAEVVDFFEAYPIGGTPASEPTEAQAKIFEKVRQFEEALDDGVCMQLQTLLDSARDDLAESLFGTGVVTRAELASMRRARIFGINGTLSEETEFEFFDRDSVTPNATPTTTKSNETPWSAGVRVGLVWLTSRTKPTTGDRSLMLSISAKRENKEQDKVAFCVPVKDFEEVTQIETCKDIALGAPVPADSIVYELEYRAFVGLQLGFGFRAFYEGSDDKTDKHGFEAPFFFIPNKDKALQGGVRLAWDDVERDPSFAVFVGKKFEIHR